jgi:glycosyltransferase involved in cell wall biosynthesis
MKSKPIFAFVTIGSGSYLGSTVRDVTLANHLHRRGFKVFLYWMMEWKPELVDKGITQRMLCHGTRYQFKQPSEFMDKVIGSLLFLLPVTLRVSVTQRLTNFVDRMLENLMRALHQTPESDGVLVKRLLKYIANDKVSHLMMSFASISPLALAAKKANGHSFDYLVTFQGDEQFSDYAQRAGVSREYRQRLNQAVRGSAWPAIAVSRDYLTRITEEMGVNAQQLSVVYNGVDLSQRKDKPPFSILTKVFPNLGEGVPIVSYVGRQEAEKGVDLLLYAAKLLKARQLPMQLVICGSTAKGPSYQKVIGELASHLGIVVHHCGAVSSEIRDALYAHSHCMVFPSVNREAFGLVAAEAMSHGTPVVVPDYGGITEVIRQDDKAGGLTFKTWNSGDLARQIERMLTDAPLHKRLAENTRSIAEKFSAGQMTDRVLEHIGVYQRKDDQEQKSVAQAATVT